MKKLSTILAVALVAALFALAGCGKEATQATGKDGGKELDAASFKQKMAARWANHIMQGASAEIKQSLTAEKVVIDKAEKATVVNGIAYYAVRGHIEPLRQGDEPRAFRIVVDQSATIEVSSLNDFSTGKSLTREAMDKVNAMTLPDNIGHVAMKGTPGKPVVTLFSDPFCNFCRKAWTWFETKKTSFSELRLVHMPLPMHPGADVACAMLTWAEKNAPAEAESMNAYAYSELPPVAVQNTPDGPAKAGELVAAAMLKKFPTFKALGKDGAAIAAAVKQDGGPMKEVTADIAFSKGIGVQGTPAIFVSGNRVDGFDQNRLEQILH